MSAAGGVQQRESTPLITILVVLFIAALAVFAANFVQQFRLSNQDQQATALAADIQVKSQQLAKYAAEAAGGRIEAFDELRGTELNIAQNIQKLVGGDAETGIPAITENPEVKPALDQVVGTWSEISAASSNVLAKEEIVLEMTDIRQQFESRVPLLQARSDEIVKVLAERGAPADQIYIAGRQVTLADRLLRRLGEIMLGDTTAADGFNRDAAIFGRVLDGLQNGNAELGIRQIDIPQARAILDEVYEIFRDIGQYVDQIVKGSTDLADVRQSSDTVSLNSNALLDNAKLLEVDYVDQDQNRVFPSLPVAADSGLETAICLLGLGFVYLRDQQRRLKVTAELNQRNQEAILRLLDEMGSLAEGDLTVRATVTEDITGAIADSINFAVEALRSLVTTINETAVQVAAAAQETQATAMHLAEAAEHQAQQITSASAAINEIAVSIDEVSRNSAESADVAQRSVQIAGKGAAIVRQTIQGMDNIRDQIQETAKRIKRLGESSQEIGSIVELINDIAEQTNILALNAAIQAASAGEAGRGFAVVADEVQRLAERASNATKRIETLVQTIQSDTNEAVNSMEQTTAEVVAGARLAEDAGLALGEIEKVSNDLADLIQNISEAARQQSAAATNISATMNVIQEITTQTSVGASQTAESIGNLAQLAADLRRSVADFKLPT